MERDEDVVENGCHAFADSFEGIGMDRGLKASWGSDVHARPSQKIGP
jgi:hypothetical protein